MKQIYVIIRNAYENRQSDSSFTGSTFNHASISLTKDLSEMYLARYRLIMPGRGFIQEFPKD